MIRRKFKGNRCLPVVIEHLDGTLEVVNPMHGLRGSNGSNLEYLVSNKVLRYRVMPFGMIISDEATGIRDDVLFETFLTPHHSTREESSKGSDFYYLSGDEANKNCKVTFVKGTVYESFDIEGLDLPDEFYFVLPGGQEVPIGKDEVIVSVSLLESMKKDVKMKS